MKAKKWYRILAVGAVAASLVFAGCTADDGSDGAAGAPGMDGSDGVSTLTLVTAEPPGANCAAGGQMIQTGVDDDGDGMLAATEVDSTEYVCDGVSATAQAEPESCAVCHNSVEEIHQATDVATVENVTSAIDGVTGDLEVNFDILLDGLPNDDFTLRRVYVYYDDPTQQTVPPTLVSTYVRDQIFRWDNTPPGDASLMPNGLGNYTVTIPAAALVADSDVLMQLWQEDGFFTDERPVVVVANGTSQLRNLVSNDRCAACHGQYPAWGKKFRHYAVGGAECQICHVRVGRDTEFVSRNAAGDLVEAAPIDGSNLAEYIHGIHNSHNMPEGTYYRTTEPEDTANIEDRYSIGFPSDMRNCAVCHEPNPAPLSGAIIAATPVSYYVCMTCHNNWDGFKHIHDAEDGSYSAGDMIITGFLNFHRNYTVGQDCMTNCHATLPTADEVSDFHDDFLFDSHSDQFYRSEDISFANNNDVTFAITGVTSDGSNVSFTWTASKLGAAVDPCNTDPSLGPTYQELGAYLAYAKGDDWVNEFVSSTPGQPAGSDDLFGELTTTCDASNVATTTGLVLNADALTYADRVLLAVGGKPVDQDTFMVGNTATDIAYFVREQSPTYAFDPADGSALPARRDAVANDKCLACHQGTLYQHGGDRVDNEQLCVICHNPASNDKNNRLDRFQIVNADGTVNTDATYDGKIGETYDMRHMIHAIHGVDKANEAWVVYRSRGIYSFVPALYEDVVLPGDDDFSTVAVDFPMPAGWPADGQTIFGSTNDSTISHNWIVVHYPKPASECLACHNEEAFEAADQTQAVALTVDPGDDYADQSDDIVIGPTAAACTACHASVPTYRHATGDFGYEANVTREEMIEKAE